MSLSCLIVIMVSLLCYHQIKKPLTWESSNLVILSFCKLCEKNKLFSGKVSSKFMSLWTNCQLLLSKKLKYCQWTKFQPSKKECGLTSFWSFKLLSVSCLNAYEDMWWWERLSLRLQMQAEVLCHPMFMHWGGRGRFWNPGPLTSNLLFFLLHSSVVNWLCTISLTFN